MSKFKAQKLLNIENIKNHNNFVESRMIANELSKFKLNIRKLSCSRRSSKSSKYEDSLENISDSDDDKSDEQKLLQALRDSEDATFAYKNDSNKIIVENKFTKVEGHELSYEESSAFSGSTATISDDSHDRAVHFETDYIKVSTQPKPSVIEFPQFHEYYDIVEDNCMFNVDEDTESARRAFDMECYTCCDDIDCQYANRNFDIHSFHSMPNLADGDIENLMKITKFQSMMTVEASLKDCPCCSTLDLSRSSTVDQKIQMLDKSIEDAETERMLIVRRMEIEEKNYQELVIMSSANSRSINDPDQTECEKIIIDLFTESQEPPENVAEKELLRSCFKDWLQKTTIAKIMKTNAFTNEDRVRKINGFLNKVRLEQNKTLLKKAKQESKNISNKHSSIKSSGNKTLKKDYEHKLKIQQDIIELQKLKIQRQERLITEIKLAKFSEMVKESKNDLKLELINAKRGNVKLRAKARCIQMAANIPLDPEEEEKRKLLAQGLMVPKFLQKMNERAAERLARHEEARERRMKLDQEKEEVKNAVDMAKKLEDEAVKRKRHQEMREKRRQEKLAKLLREQERQRYLENVKKAREHYERNLMKQLGFKAFEFLIRLKRTNHKKSTIHRRKMCMKKSFSLWFLNAKCVWDHKRAQADRLYELSLVKGCIRVWRHVHNIHQSKFLVAVDWYEVKISEKLLKFWIQFTKRSKIIEGSKMKSAEAHYNW